MRNLGRVHVARVVAGLDQPPRLADPTAAAGRPAVRRLPDLRGLLGAQAAQAAQAAPDHGAVAAHLLAGLPPATRLVVLVAVVLDWRGVEVIVVVQVGDGRRRVCLRRHEAPERRGRRRGGGGGRRLRAPRPVPRLPVAAEQVRQLHLSPRVVQGDQAAHLYFLEVGGQLPVHRHGLHVLVAALHDPVEGLGRAAAQRHVTVVHLHGHVVLHRDRTHVARP